MSSVMGKTIHLPGTQGGRFSVFSPKERELVGHIEPSPVFVEPSPVFAQLLTLCPPLLLARYAFGVVRHAAV